MTVACLPATTAQESQIGFKVAAICYNHSLGLVYSVCISGGNNVKLHGILVCLFTDREILAPVLPLGIFCNDWDGDIW